MQKITLQPSPFSPSEAARLEIISLASAPELQTNTMIGGPTPAAMKAENERKDEERRRRRLEIIAKHGVADEYLKPLYEEERRLSEELKKVRTEIKALEKIKK